MQTLPMRFLLLSSILFFSCSPSWKHLQPANGDLSTLNKFKPDFTVALYNTQVDVMGNHLSGLLMIKKMPDKSTRLVFSNEMGYKFFDFEFDSAQKFRVHSVIKQMNKKAVLKTLSKDLELVLMQNLNRPGMTVRSSGSLIYYILPQKKGYNYYITDSSGNKLVRLERASRSKAVVEAVMKDYVGGIPDTIGISHKNFDMTIGLKRIERDITE
jgi:hypothetical protein